MRSTTILLAAATAFANSALAQVAGFAVFSTPLTDEVVPAGKPYVVKWTAGKYTGPVTLSLIGGETQGTQIPLGELGTHIEVSDNQFKWNVDCSLGAAKIYGLKITSEKDADLFQWSFPFKISNKGCDATSSVVPTPTPASTSYPASTPTTPASSYATSTPSSHSSKTTVETTAESSTAVSTALTTVVTTTKATTTSSPATTTPTSTSTTLPTAAATRVAGSFALAGIAAVAALAL